LKGLKKQNQFTKKQKEQYNLLGVFKNNNNNNLLKKKNPESLCSPRL